MKKTRKPSLSFEHLPAPQKYDYDSSTVRKKFFREALLQITIPYMLQQLRPSCSPVSIASHTCPHSRAVTRRHFVSEINGEAPSPLETTACQNCVKHTVTLKVSNWPAQCFNCRGAQSTHTHTHFSEANSPSLFYFENDTLQSLPVQVESSVWNTWGCQEGLDLLHQPPQLTIGPLKALQQKFRSVSGKKYWYVYWLLIYYCHWRSLACLLDLKNYECCMWSPLDWCYWVTVRRAERSEAHSHCRFSAVNKPKEVEEGSGSEADEWRTHRSSSLSFRSFLDSRSSSLRTSPASCRWRPCSRRWCCTPSPRTLWWVRRRAKH